MMRKKIFLPLIFMLLTFSSAFSQRHLKGLKAAEVGIGLSDLGYFTKIGGSYNLSRKLTAAGEFMIEKGDVLNFDFYSYNLAGKLFYTPFSLKETVFINVGPGITGNFSSIKEAEGGKNKNQFDYGFLAAIEIETYISNKLAWLITADQRWYISNKFGSLAWYAGTSLKYSF